MRLWPRRNSKTDAASLESRGNRETRHRDDGMDDGYMNIDDLGNTTAAWSLTEMMQAREAIAAARQKKTGL